MENTAFQVSININNFETGSLANPNESFYAAPQEVNGQGFIIGNTYVAVPSSACGYVDSFSFFLQTHHYPTVERASRY